VTVDQENVLLNRDLDRVGIHVGKVHPDHEPVFRVKDIGRDVVPTPRPPRFRASEEALEEVVEVIASVA
jgi:hypothetical protein